MARTRGRYESFARGFSSPELERGRVRVREATADDAEGIAALVRLADRGDRDTGAAHATDELDARSLTDRIRSWPDRDDRYLLVATSDGCVVGYGRAAWFEPDDDAAEDTAPPGWYLVGLMVDPAWRGRGIARELTRARLDWIASRGTEAWYFANARNAVSLRLHASLGFEEVTREFSFPGVSFQGGTGVLGRLTLPDGLMAERGTA